jgi:hypothetical protein
MEECEAPKACTILLRGGSKDFLNEVERNLQDAMQVARNIVFEPKLLPGGGATEMALSVGTCLRVHSCADVVVCCGWRRAFHVLHFWRAVLSPWLCRLSCSAAELRETCSFVVFCAALCCFAMCAVCCLGVPALTQRAKTIEGVEQWPFRAVGHALEVIPRTLAQNCGADTVRLLTELRVCPASVRLKPAHVLCAAPAPAPVRRLCCL